MGVAALLIVVAIIWWAAKRETALDKEIQSQILALRAANEPVTAQDLARLFPDPPPGEDAGILLSNAFNLASDNHPPGSTPIISSGPMPRHESLAEPMARQLRAYCEDTKSIFEQTTPWPDKLRFASHWQNGVENYSTAHFVKVRVFVQFLAVQALDAIEVKDATRATEILTRSFQFSQTVPSDSLVSHMIRQACVGLTATMTERALNRVSFNNAQLTLLADALPPASTNSFSNALRGEHVYAIWAFQEIKAGRSLDSITTRHRGRETWWKELWQKLKPHRNEYSDRDFVRYLSLCRPSLEALALPPAQAIMNITELMNAYSTNATSEVAQAILANWTKALRTHFDYEARLAVLRTALAVERYRLAHDGKFPPSLNALVPAYLREVPRDPFDEQPLRFKPLSPGYVIYSIGADGVDDGGLEKVNAITNYDVTITVER